MNKNREKLIARQKLLDGGFLRISNELIKHYDPALSVFITILLQCEKYADDNGLVSEKYPDFFLCTREYVASRVKLTPFQQRIITRDLKELGIAEYKLIGTPAKGYYKLNHSILNEILEKDCL